MDDIWCGRRILLVEDEPIIALEIAQALTDLGAAVAGPAHTLAQAQALAAADDLSAAILDLTLGNTEAWPVAEALHARGVPILFHTGNMQVDRLKRSFPGCAVVAKPASAEALTAALATRLHAQILATRAPALNSHPVDASF
jgi:DNA-binding response OmpR family regulator